MKAPERLVPTPPISPGEVLRERILGNRKMTQEQLAKAMQVSRLSVNQLVNGRRAVTAEMALRLARVTTTTPNFWLNLQRDVDLFEAEVKLADTLPQLGVLREPKSGAELIVDVAHK